MAKILCMEIGVSTVRLAEAVVKKSKKGKQAKITKVYVFDTPDDAMKDGKVRVSNSIVSAIRDGIDKSGITATDVYFCVESTRILFKQVDLPVISKREVLSALTTSFSDYFPVDETLYHLSYVIEKYYEKNGQKMMGVDVFAVPNDLSESFYNLSVTLGLNAKGLTDTSRSMMSLFPVRFRNKNIAMINMNEMASTLSIITNGDMVFNKTIPYGVSQTLRAVMNSPLTSNTLSVTEAAEMLYSRSILMRQMPSCLQNEEDEQEKLRFETTSSMIALTKTIAATFTAFLAKEKNIRIEEFFLSGLGAGFAGVAQLLSSEFGITVSIVQSDENITIANEVADETLVLSCFPCVGSATDSCNLFTPEEKAGGDLAKKKEIDRMFLTVGSICCFGAVGFSVINILDVKMKTMEANANKSRLERKIQELINYGVQDAFDKYNAAKSYNDQVKILYKETESGNEDITVFLGELERKLPKTARVVSMQLTPDTATVTFVCSDKFVAAGVLHRLRNLETINNMQSSSVAEIVTTGELTFQCTFNLKTTLDRNPYVMRDENGNPILDENGNPIIDEEAQQQAEQNNETTSQSGNEQNTTPQVALPLVYTLPQNTEVDMDKITFNAEEMRFTELTLEELEERGFKSNGQIFAVANKAIEANGIVFSGDNQIELEVGTNSDDIISIIGTNNPDVKLTNGICVGMDISEVMYHLGATNTPLNDVYAVFKNKINTIVVAVDEETKTFVKKIYLINNETFGLNNPIQQPPIETTPVGETMPQPPVHEPSAPVDSQPTNPVEG